MGDGESKAARGLLDPEPLPRKELGGLFQKKKKRSSAGAPGWIAGVFGQQNCRRMGVGNGHFAVFTNTLCIWRQAGLPVAGRKEVWRRPAGEPTSNPVVQ
jgi:hypothetical protein